MKVALFRAMFLMALACSAEATLAKGARWTGSAVYVFDSYVVLDMNRQEASFVPQRRYALADCSTNELTCVSAGKISPWAVAFAVPATCSKPQLGQTWSVGGVMTRVIAIQPPSADAPRGGNTANIYYLASPSDDSVVYEYTPTAGIRSIIAGGRGSRIVQKIAQSQSIPDELLHKVHTLVTLDRLAACEGASR